jgi:hypothetical protein
MYTTLGKNTYKDLVNQTENLFFIDITRKCGEIQIYNIYVEGHSVSLFRQQL